LDHFFSYHQGINCYEKRIKHYTDENQKLSADLRRQNVKKSSSSSTERKDLVTSELRTFVADEDQEMTDTAKDHQEENENDTKMNRQEMKKKLKSNRIKLAKHYLALGHFYLLIYDYVKALHAYQKFLQFKVNKLKVCNFFFSFPLFFEYINKCKYICMSISYSFILNGL
jgi:hypothetical protein